MNGETIIRLSRRVLHGLGAFFFSLFEAFMFTVCFTLCCGVWKFWNRPQRKRSLKAGSA